MDLFIYQVVAQQLKLEQEREAELDMLYRYSMLVCLLDILT